MECLIADIRLTDTRCLAIAKSRREKWDELKVKLDKSWKINLGNNCEEVRLATGYSCVSIYLIVFTNSIRNNLKIFTQIQSVENCSTAGDSIYFEVSPALNRDQRVILIQTRIISAIIVLPILMQMHTIYTHIVQIIYL